MPSTLFVAAVILMALFAKIYYNHHLLVFWPVIGLPDLGLTSKVGFSAVFRLALHDSLLNSTIAITVT